MYLKSCKAIKEKKKVRINFKILTVLKLQSKIEKAVSSIWRNSPFYIYIAELTTIV